MVDFLQYVLKGHRVIFSFCLQSAGNEVVDFLQYVLKGHRVIFSFCLQSAGNEVVDFLQYVLKGHRVIFSFCLQSAGNEVVDFLQYVCSNDIDKPIGSILHTGMQNHSGGYENDCSVVRLAHNK